MRMKNSYFSLFEKKQKQECRLIACFIFLIVILITRVLIVEKILRNYLNVKKNFFLTFYSFAVAQLKYVIF